MAGADPAMGNPALIAHAQMFIGFFINVLLCGIMTTQVYLYGVTYKRDPMWIKIAVALIFVADLLQTGFLFGYLYRSLIIYYAQAEVLGQADWIFATDPALTGLIAMAVQFFFAWRVKVLTKNWYFSCIIIALATAGGVAGVLTAFEVGRTPTFTEFQNFKATVIVWLAAEAVCDVVITVILVWYLRKHKTGFSQSDLIVDRIIRLTMQTGFITMVVAALDLIFFLVDPKGTHLAFNFPLAKLYTNSLMSSLNSRKGWNFSGGSGGAQTQDMESNHIHVSSTAKPNMSLSGRDIKSNAGAQVSVLPTRPEVYVHVESHELVDVTKPKPRLNLQPLRHGTQAWASMDDNRKSDANSTSSMEMSEGERRRPEW